MINPWVLAAGGCALAPAVLLVAGHGGFARRLRGALHTLSLAAFCAAGWLLAQERGTGAGLGLYLGGSFVTGFFWVLFVRRRLAHHAARSPADVDVDLSVTPEPSAGGGTDEDEESARTARVFLDRLMDLKSTSVGTIAVPRANVVAADCGRGIEPALATMRSRGFLRIPMTDGNLDRVVGILHAKDLVPIALERRPLPALKSVMRRPLFVSRDRTVAGLLELFRAQRGHMAIVVDERNTTVGIATRDDIFRFLTAEEKAP